MLNAYFSYDTCSCTCLPDHYFDVVPIDGKLMIECQKHEDHIKLDLETDLPCYGLTNHRCITNSFFNVYTCNCECLPGYHMIFDFRYECVPDLEHQRFTTDDHINTVTSNQDVTTEHYTKDQTDLPCNGMMAKCIAYAFFNLDTCQCECLPGFHIIFNFMYECVPDLEHQRFTTDELTNTVTDYQDVTTEQQHPQHFE
jgi:hypothetical protein